MVHRSLKLFLSYAHEDEALRKEIAKQLYILKQHHRLDIWTDHDIRVGSDWSNELHAQLDKADLILLLLSTDFMASDYCQLEMQRALERHENKEARVVPILLRPVFLENGPVSRLQALPTGARPVTAWENPDDAYVDIAQRLDIVLKELQGPLDETEAEQSQEDSMLALEKELSLLPVTLINFRNGISASEEDIDNYYKGLQLDWKIILARADVERDQLQNLIENYREPINKTRMVCLSGEPGAGKSTLARRLAFEITQQSTQGLLEIDNSGSSDIWYQLKKVLVNYQQSLVIFVEDVFRSDEAKIALRSFGSDLNVTIIATTRSSEIPDDVCLPFLDIVPIQRPSEEEKRRVGQKLHKGSLSKAQKQRLAEANSWLIMMMELVGKESLGNIVRDSINKLKNHANDPQKVVYRAYEYLCYAGQYQVSLPKTLLHSLDAEGRFYKIEEDPIGKGLIFYKPRNTSYSTLHPVFAELAFKVCRRDPVNILMNFIEAVQVNQGSHRTFLHTLLSHIVATGQQEDFVKDVLAKKPEKVMAILAACTHNELWHFWRGLYCKLHETEKIPLIEKMMVNREPEGLLDWTVYLNFLDEKGANEQLIPAQWNSVIEDTTQWFKKYAGEDCEVCRVYLKLVARRGSREQWKVAIDSTMRWIELHADNKSLLDAYITLLHKQNYVEAYWDVFLEEVMQWFKIHEGNFRVRAAYLRLLKKREKKEHWNIAIENTTQWLKTHPEDVHVRTAYVELFNWRGRKEYWKVVNEDSIQWLQDHEGDVNMRRACFSLIDRKEGKGYWHLFIKNTASWLKMHPEDTHVRAAYLGLVDRGGSKGHRKVAIESTAQWLRTYQNDTNVRATYLSLVEKHGNEAQWKVAIEDTVQWFETHPDSSHVRSACLALIDKRGSEVHRYAFIENTTPWIKNHLDDSAFCRAYLKLVTQRGTPQQQKVVIDNTMGWIDAGYTNAHILTAYLRLIDIGGTPEQCSNAIERGIRWLYFEPDNLYIHAAYLILVARHGNREQATTACHLVEKWLNKHPRIKNTYIIDNYGNILFNLQLYDQAEKQFQQVLTLDAAYLPARISLAWCYYYQGKKQEAHTELSRSQRKIESGNEYPLEGINLHLGRYWMLEGKPKKAIEYFQSAVSEGSSYQSYLELGRALLALQDYSPAIQALEKAKELLSDTVRPEVSQEIERLLADVQLSYTKRVVTPGTMPDS